VLRIGRCCNGILQCLFRLHVAYDAKGNVKTSGIGEESVERRHNHQEPRLFLRIERCVKHLLVVFLFLLFLLLVLLLSLPGSLSDGSGDTVQIPLAVLGDSSSTVLGLFEDTDLLEGLADLALDAGGRITVVRGAVSATVLATVKLGEGTDTDILAEVDVTSDGS